MKILKFLTLLSLFAFSLFASYAFAENEAIHSDHVALMKHYENLAKEAEAKLQENKEALDQYEAHPYYYGRQGQDLQSHASANIREYEKALKESLNQADLHRKMAMTQDRLISEAKLNLNEGSAAIR